jgi:hypothetical protein
MSRFIGRFGVNDFGNFSINFAAALKKHKKILKRLRFRPSKHLRQTGAPGEASKQ